MSRKKESFCFVIESAPLSLNTGQLPVSVGQSPFNCDVGRTADGGEGDDEEEQVVVDTDTMRLVPKGGNGSKNASPSRGCIGLEFQRNNDDKGSGIADIA